MGKNDGLIDARQGLTGGELVKAFRYSEIFKNYRFRGEIMSRASAIDFVAHTESDLQDQDFRDQFSTYLGPINRIS